MRQQTRVLLEGTVVAALALVLSLIPTNIGSSFSISLGMIPLTLYAFRRGTKAGLMSALIWGLLHFPLGLAYFLSVVQVLIEYPIAFTFAGFAGLYAKKVQASVLAGDKSGLTKNIVLGSLVGTLARYFWHFVAGVAFWGSYALWGMNPFLFSLVMNGASGLATGLVTAIVLVVIGKTHPQLFVPKDGALVSRPVKTVK